MDEKKTYPSYEAPTPKQPSYNGRLSDNRYHHSTRESRDREIVATTATPTGKYYIVQPRAVGAKGGGGNRGDRGAGGDQIAPVNQRKQRQGDCGDDGNANRQVYCTN